MSLSVVCRLVQMACLGAHMLSKLNKVLQNGGVGILKKIDLGVDVSILLLNTIEIAGNSMGFLNSSLLKVKNIEFTIKLLAFSFQAADTLFESTGPEEQLLATATKIKTVERILLQLLSVLRIGSEKFALEEKVYLDMTSEELAKQRCRIYDNNVEPPSIIGYKTVTIEDCQQILESETNKANALNLTESILATQVTSHLADKAIIAYTSLIQNLNHANNDPFDLRALNEIPAELHQDVIFSRYVCSINLIPVRDPVGDPNGHQVYERSQIIKWINLHGTSPMTRAPLTINQLLPKPALKGLIDSRLEYHEQHLRAFARNNPHLNIQANPVLSNAAALENPFL